MRPRVEQASALLVATTLAALLATAAMALILSARNVQASAADAHRLEQTRLHGESLIAQALVQLDAGEGGALSGDPASDAKGHVRVQEAAGLVDINLADSTTIAALFRALGIAGESAPTLADAVADWRDSDDLRRPFGAEANDYAAAELPPPGNRPFATETELRLVLGMPSRLAQCAMPYITIHGAQAPSPATAPPFLRAALQIGPAPIPMSGAPLGRLLIITADAPISADAVLRTTRWVRLTGDPNRPVLTQRAFLGFAPPRETHCVTA